jgi:hypothetical protein
MKPPFASSTYDADARMIQAWAELNLDHLEDAADVQARRVEIARLWIRRVMAQPLLIAGPATQRLAHSSEESRRS